MPPRPASRPAGDSIAGRLLLAHPSLRDAHFRRTAVLMSAHDGEGAMGVVLNRPLGRRLGQLGGDFALGPLADVPVFAGGPVMPRQLVLCAWRPREDGEPGMQLVFGLDPERATEIVGEPGVCVRAYLGHAGWSAGQLEGELERDAWVVAEMDAAVVMLAPDDGLWRALIGGLGPRWAVMAGEPDEPELN